MRRSRISIGFSEKEFAEALAPRVATVGTRPVDAVEQLLTQILVENLRQQTALALRKIPSVKLHSMYFKERCASLARLADIGYDTWYAELAFSTTRENMVDGVEIDTQGLHLSPINCGPAGLITHRLWSKQLKTQTNHILRLNHVTIPPSTFLETKKMMEAICLEQPLVANPRPGPRTQGYEFGIEGFEFVAFDHLVTGKRCFCSCARLAHEKMMSEAIRIASHSGAWTHQVVRLLSDATYIDEICHLCIARRSGPEAAASFYGDDIGEFITPYIDQLMLMSGMDKSTARSEVQYTLGVRRWMREAEMYSLVKKLFPDQVILREASPPWLGRQRFDVYLPAIGLALEHHGEQHYRAITAFGGEVALKRNMERDALKRSLCEQNAVQLVEIRFDEQMTLPLLRRKLRRFIMA
ncbi:MULTISPECIES: hypothetical protein [Rhizobium/Agrobacterium group]|uniref:Uncharacterized protein n=5 Tax=Rhizobium/Agrobacterium group TaxID=227290 RepID=A0A2Z2PFX1_RHIRH|nr:MULTISPECIES: hypothetical protein [Rhizobium/Agrobacterium group]AQS65424.1 hypothetical protein B0909_23880 [Rhizobium rhizogenes]ASK42164.1 hypothetical protein [Rhizobium rhizogenes]MCZ7445591.1 hypothetical protein [Rhizobium rhizogenes]MCZ7472462.1 hypothetical protein [Rhizobium rhizogenes]MCZ7497562.1 hypothetical protein [Rhizobium rhizogenes]